MIVADVLFYLLIVAGFYLIFISYWVVAEALFPQRVEQCRVRYATPIRTTLVGVLVALPLFLGAFVLVQHMGNPVFQITGVVLAAFVLITGLLGSTGLCRQIGLGLPRPQDDAQPWRRVARGGVVLGMTFVLPVVGWFIVLPWVLISGFGAMLRVQCARKKKLPKA